MRNRYIVCYDIADAKRLTKMFKKMRGFGDPLQYSVFSCELSRQEKVMLISAVSDIIHHKEDRVMIINTGPVKGRGEDAFEFLGCSVTFDDSTAIII
ncbi:MAG: CRISPR-associated endonuclease Cas2 [Dethiobacteria bacterium]